MTAIECLSSGLIYAKEVSTEFVDKTRNYWYCSRVEQSWFDSLWILRLLAQPNVFFSNLSQLRNVIQKAYLKIGVSKKLFIFEKKRFSCIIIFFHSQLCIKNKQPLPECLKKNSLETKNRSVVKHIHRKTPAYPLLQADWQRCNVKH